MRNNKRESKSLWVFFTVENTSNYVRLLQEEGVREDYFSGVPSACSKYNCTLREEGPELTKFAVRSDVSMTTLTHIGLNALSSIEALAMTMGCKSKKKFFKNQ